MVDQNCSMGVAKVEGRFSGCSKVLSNRYFIIFFIAVFSVVIRIVGCKSIDEGGDAFWVWRLCRDFLEQGRAFAGPGVWDHRMLRWGLHLPMFVVQSLFGATPGSYFFWAFTSATVTAILVYLTGEKLVSKTAGFLAAITVVLYPAMVHQGSQILPMGNAAMWVAAGFYCLLKWRERHGWWWLVLSSVFVFIGYGCKVTVLFYVPGFVLFILYDCWKGGKGAVVRNVGIFAGVLLALFVVECLFYQQITTTAGGRFGCLLKGRHGNVEGREESLSEKDTTWRGQSKTLQHYLFNFMAYKRYLRSKDAFLLNFGLLAAFLILILRLRNLFALGFVFIPAYLLHTYLFIGAFPFYRAERVHSRYHLICYILGILMFVCLLSSLRNRVGLRIFDGGNEKDNQGCGGDEKKFNVSVGVLLALLFVFFTAEVPYPTDYFAKAMRNYDKVEVARREGVSILMAKSSDMGEDWKYIKRYRAFYGDTDVPFYSRPQMVKLKEEEVYYVLELPGGSFSRERYLQTSNRHDFEFVELE